MTRLTGAGCAACLTRRWVMPACTAIFNPTETTSQAYQEDMLCDDPDGVPRWHRIRLSVLEHPNIKAELEGRPKPVPGAISLDTLRGWIADWAEPVEHQEDVRATDVEFPPGSGRWYRPGPIFQSRALGLWPDAGGGVWSPSLWQACFPFATPPFPLNLLPEIGVDCSQGKGEGFTFALALPLGSGFAPSTRPATRMDAVQIADRGSLGRTGNGY